MANLSEIPPISWQQETEHYVQNNLPLEPVLC